MADAGGAATSADAGGRGSEATGTTSAEAGAWLQSSQRVRLSRALLSVATQGADAVVIAEPSETGPRVIYANPAFLRLTGYSAADWVGQGFSRLHGPNTDSLARERMRAAMARREPVQVEVVNYRQDGSEYWVELSITPIFEPDGRLSHWVSVQRETTERQRVEQALQRQALHDPLTGLPNRTLFNDRLQQALLHARRQNASLSLLVMDLDRFKDVNDTFGHDAGDALLREVATRLGGALRQSDTLARLGGDEFAVVLPQATSETASLVAEKLIATLSKPVALNGSGGVRNLHVGTSVGIATYPEHGEDTETILRRADIAMYVAKRMQHGFTVYAADQDHYSATRLSVVGDLHAALALDELRLYYQPQVDVTTGRFVKAEGLLRWQHPTRQLMLPGQFLPMAEETGLIRSVTLWVVEAALRQCRAWRGQGLEVTVAVNLSMRNLHDPQFLTHVADMVERHQAPAGSLQVEITESSLMAEPDRALAVLAELRRLGVSIAIDDFGTGFSSLAYLSRLPVDELKIDRSFVQGMRASSKQRSLVRSTIDLGHALDLRVTAEGVEEHSTLDQLRAFRCDLAQGFLIGRPMTDADLAAWLSRSTAPRARSLIRAVKPRPAP